MSVDTEDQNTLRRIQAGILDHDLNYLKQMKAAVSKALRRNYKQRANKWVQGLLIIDELTRDTRKIHIAKEIYDRKHKIGAFCLEKKQAICNSKH